MKKQSYDIHSDITNRIIAAIEAGAGPFRMPWHGAGTMQVPRNAVTRKAYRGINVLSLWITAQERAYSCAKWATFRQWQVTGAAVRKGEKATPIVFYKQIELDSGADSAEAKTVPFARASWVFNAAQVEGYAAEAPPARAPTVFERLDHAEASIKATRAAIAYGGNRAYYDRGTDRIQVPDASSFIGSLTSTPRESFYGTVLHELAHWSGAKSRLNREKGKRFADRIYAFEEIIAELSAAFSCARLGITDTPRDEHAQYISQYLEILRSDKKAVFIAAAAAATATDYILAFLDAPPESEAA